jgi:hypothetical protein
VSPIIDAAVLHQFDIVRHGGFVEEEVVGGTHPAPDDHDFSGYRFPGAAGPGTNTTPDSKHAM